MSSRKKAASANSDDARPKQTKTANAKGGSHYHCPRCCFPCRYCNSVVAAHPECVNFHKNLVQKRWNLMDKLIAGQYIELYVKNIKAKTDAWWSTKWVNLLPSPGCLLNLRNTTKMIDFLVCGLYMLLVWETIDDFIFFQLLKWIWNVFIDTLPPFLGPFYFRIYSHCVVI